MEDPMGNRYLTTSARIADLARQSGPRPLTVAPDNALKALLGTLAQARGTGQVYVVDAGGRLCGSLSLLTLLEQKFPLVALTADTGKKIPSRKRGCTLAREVMRLRPLHLTSETRVLDAVRIMLRERVTELPVVDERMRFLDELTAAQILAALPGQSMGEAPIPTGILASVPA
jgi:CBS domain-containing protein